MNGVRKAAVTVAAGVVLALGGGAVPLQLGPALDARGLRAI